MGAIINAVVVFICGSIGAFLNTGIPSRISDTIMKGIGLCVIVIGLEGALAGEETIIMIVSIVLGILVGEGLDFHQRVNDRLQTLEKRVIKTENKPSLAQGLISAALIMCVGSMTIIGSLEAGLVGDNTTLLTKTVIDGTTAILLASSLGIGVAFASVPILVIEGSLTIFAVFLEPVLPPIIITEVIAVGSLLLIGLGLNIMNITDLKIMNYTPAMFFPILIMPFI